MIVIKRDMAAANGLKKYYTGVPCSRGHDAERYINTGACIKCIAEYAKQRAKRINIIRNSGIIRVPITAHHEDIAAIEAYAAMLIEARIPYFPGEDVEPR